MKNGEKWWKSKDPQLQLETKELRYILGALELIGVVCAVMTIASLVLMRENALFWLVLTALSFTIVFAYKAIVEYVIEKAGNGKE